MSNIYITEPPTKGKVLLKTSVGDIDIELWSKETPLACRNFVQLCMEEYYNGTIFHRVIQDFIAQGGDPTGTGEGGESIYGRPFKDEFHTRLKFNRRGLVGMVNGGHDDNGAQFFFTLGRADELNKKNTLFGKVTGDTIYNLLKFNDVPTDNTDRPFEPPRIHRTEILNNPFDDIVPRESRNKTVKGKEEKIKSQSKATKNFSLLSFGEEAEDDEDELMEVNKHHKIKSSHDVLTDDSTLVADLAVVDSDLKKSPTATHDIMIEEREKEEEEEEEGQTMTRVDELKRKAKLLSKEIREAKRQRLQDEADKQALEDSLPEAVKEIKKERARYMSRKNLLPMKGGEREDATLEMLMKFRSKLVSARVEKKEEESGTIMENNEIENTDNKIETDDDWLYHQVTFNEERIVLSKDALVKDMDYYDIYDPRNPLNERRRQDQTQKPIKKNKI